LLNALGQKLIVSQTTGFGLTRIAIDRYAAVNDVATRKPVPLLTNPESEALMRAAMPRSVGSDWPGDSDHPFAERPIRLADCRRAVGTG
jgi:hypothetical protein